MLIIFTAYYYAIIEVEIYLFVCNRVTYRQPIWNDGTMLVRYWPNIESVKAHRKKAEEMLDALPSAR